MKFNPIWIKFHERYIRHFWLRISLRKRINNDEEKKT